MNFKEETEYYTNLSREQIDNLDHEETKKFLDVISRPDVSEENELNESKYNIYGQSLLSAAYDLIWPYRRFIHCGDNDKIPKSDYSPEVKKSYDIYFNMDLLARQFGLYFFNKQEQMNNNPQTKIRVFRIILDLYLMLIEIEPLIISRGVIKFYDNYFKNINNDKCYVCEDENTTDKHTKCLWFQCNHALCFNCYDNLVNNVCPMCRAEQKQI
jgi:hypothetical protein